MAENLVIYRKYRPQMFSEVVGQEHVVRTLQGALASSRIPHAYIFAGPRGTGKTTIARIFAKALNCSYRSNQQPETRPTADSQKPKAESREPRAAIAEPCNVCQSCIEIREGRSLDLLEIDAASNRGIDEIRELREGIRFAPMHGKYKVYIVDEFHMLTKEAFNALLKTLEEPPAHAIFILATTEIQKVPDTVVSRSLRFDFRLLTEAEIVGELERILQHEGLAVDREALVAVARNAAGSMRDAESIAEQLFLLGKKKISYEEAKEILGFTDVHLAIELAENMLAGKTAEALSFLDEAYEKGEDFDNLLALLTEWFRKLLLYRVDASLEKLLTKDLSPDHIETLKRHASQATAQAFAKIESLLIDKELEMKRTSFPRLSFELAVVEIEEILKTKS